MKKALTTLLFVATSLSVGGEMAYADPLCYFDSPDGTRIDLSTWCGRGSTSAPLTSDMTTTAPNVTTPNSSNAFQVSITQIRQSAKDNRGNSKEPYDWYISGTIRSNLPGVVISVQVDLDAFQLFEGSLRKIGSFSPFATKAYGYIESDKAYDFELGVKFSGELDVVKVTRVTGFQDTSRGRVALNDSRLHACYPERYCDRSVLGRN